MPTRTTRRRYGNGSRRLFPSNREESKNIRVAPSPVPVENHKQSAPKGQPRSELSDLYAAIDSGEDIFAEIAQTEEPEPDIPVADPIINDMDELLELDPELEENPIKPKRAPKQKERYVKEMVKRIKNGQIDYQQLIELKEKLMYKQSHPESEIYLTKDMTALLKKIDRVVKKVYTNS